jgi:D-glycero-D-manno-heptose 1,7-bisphosphate phosphatase
VRRAAVFLDLDGTLNRAFERDGESVPPRDVSEFALLRGVKEAVEQLRVAGLALVVVTNQHDVARGTLSRAMAEDLNGAFTGHLNVNLVMSCDHDDPDQYLCRKPKPGMLFAAAEQLDLDLETSFMVGDRWRDTGAGRNAGCATLQIRTSLDTASREDVAPDYWVESLAEAVPLIIRLYTLATRGQRVARGDLEGCHDLVGAEA